VPTCTPSAPTTRTVLLKAAALVAATANGTLILDLGNGVVEGEVIIDVTAIEVDTTDESYEIIVQGSPDATFATAGNIVALGSIVIGHASSVRLTSQGQGTTTWRPLHGPDPQREERHDLPLHAAAHGRRRHHRHGHQLLGVARQGLGPQARKGVSHDEESDHAATRRDLR
jgi:hypothetical protein